MKATHTVIAISEVIVLRHLVWSLWQHGIELDQLKTHPVCLLLKNIICLFVPFLSRWKMS